MMGNFEVNEAYLHSQLEEVRQMNNERTRQTDQYLSGLWNQYRMLLIIGIPTLLFSGCGLAYHQFTLHKLNNIQQDIKSQQYQELHQSINELKEQEGAGYEETCNSFLGMRRCHREVK